MSKQPQVLDRNNLPQGSVDDGCYFHSAFDYLLVALLILIHGVLHADFSHSVVSPLELVPYKCFSCISQYANEVRTHSFCYKMTLELESD